MARAWGMPTWIFLHTLIAKMPESEYKANETLSQIKSLCAVLPCPDCASHATQFFASINAKHVPTKESFKQLLWRFHNTVNLRTRKQMFPLEKLSIYDTISFQVVYNVFITEFMRPQHNPKLFTDSMMRRRVIDGLRIWLSSIKF